MSHLESSGANLWTCPVKLSLMGFQLGGRMTVIRLKDQSLLLYSPVRLTEELKKELDALGPVRNVIAPNFYHHLFIRDYQSAYPEAKFFAASPLHKKRKNFPFDGVLNESEDYPWGHEVLLYLYPFKPGVHEAILYHPESQSLVLTDLIFNIQNATGRTKWALRLYGCYQKAGPSRLVRWMTKDKASARALIDRILQKDFAQVILCHGEILRDHAKETFRKGFEFLKN